LIPDKKSVDFLQFSSFSLKKFRAFNRLIIKGSIRIRKKDLSESYYQLFITLLRSQILFYKDLALFILMAVKIGNIQEFGLR